MEEKKEEIDIIIEEKTEQNLDVYARLRLLKQLYGYSFKQIADGCNCSKFVIVRSFNGLYDPNKKVKQKIAEFFKLNPLDLWKEEGQNGNK